MNTHISVIIRATDIKIDMRLAIYMCMVKYILKQGCHALRLCNAAFCDCAAYLKGILVSVSLHSGLHYLLFIKTAKFC